MDVIRVVTARTTRICDLSLVAIRAIAQLEPARNYHRETIGSQLTILMSIHHARYYPQLLHARLAVSTVVARTTSSPFSRTSARIRETRSKRTCPSLRLPGVYETHLLPVLFKKSSTALLLTGDAGCCFPFREQDIT
jgi:hypothetical protein